MKYKFSNLAILATSVITLIACFTYAWKGKEGNFVNYIDGDARFYYQYLHSTFIKDFPLNISHAGNSVMTHHPAGVALLMLPFFLVALAYASLFNYPLDGLSEPFQIAICLSAVFYSLLGLVYLKKLFQLNNVSDKISALTITLIFFGTNLYHYTVIESAMSHAYSFCFITLFLYHSYNFVVFGKNKHLILSALIFGIILLLRPNNGLIIFFGLFWFRSKEQMVSFFKNLFRNKAFYFSLFILILFAVFQVLVWIAKENQLFSNRYAPYGFDWLKPHFIKMLFGFSAGFFVYTPLCFLFLFGLISVYKQNKFLFYAIIIFLIGVFYFLSAYSAYTYHDGLGIRVLIDYYGIFALLGAKLFMSVVTQKLLFTSLVAGALFFTAMSLVYSYQSKKEILLHSGMTFSQWKYIFFKTNTSYQNVLGGGNDLTPYSKEEAKLVLKKNAEAIPFDYSQKDFGVVIPFDSIGFTSNRVQIKINVARKENFINSSKDAMICIALEDKQKQNKAYTQYKLNEIPASDCCEERECFYQTTVFGDFQPNDRLLIYVWNIEKQAFSINKFSAQVYNYNYQIN